MGRKTRRFIHRNRITEIGFSPVFAPVVPRLRLWIGVALSILIVFGLRLTDIMVLRGKNFRAMADSNRLQTLSVLPSRGILTDRKGIALTENGRQFYAVATASAQSLYPKKTHPITSSEAASLQLERLSSVLAVPTRSYPFAPALTHVVGYIGFPTRSDITQKYIGVDERVGKTGAEYLFDSTLRGVSGSDTYELSSNGKVTSKVSQQLPLRGKSLTLSIDAALTNTSYEALGEYTGAVVVVDISSSSLLALTSKPSFELSSLGQALSDPKKPLLNRAVSNYPPGSTFKLITALAALETGKMTADTTVVDEGQLKVGEQTFGNWYFRQYGRTEGAISLTRALARSNDIYFYTAAQQVGPEAMDDIAFKLGLGRPTGIGLMEEQTGLLPTPEWKEKEVGTKWYLGDTYHMGIGQGFVLATPVQIANMTAAIGRSGQWCELSLTPHSQPTCEDSEIKPESLQTVVTGMVQACSNGGTAFPFFPHNEVASEDLKVACKTGTAEYGPSDEKGHKKTHGWFTMFYPTNEPEVAITVLVESTPEKQFLEGSADAAPIALKVFEEWKKMGK